MQPERLIDANLNRLREGMRVCEDILRFAFDDQRLWRRFKDLRHEIQPLTKRAGIGTAELIKFRDVQRDVGKASTNTERKRASLSEIFCCNLQRCKESLRVLEEITKLVNAGAAQKFKLIRYKFYVLEKDAIEKLGTLRNHR